MAVEKNLRVIDATCPLVTKVHNEARKYSKEGYDIVLIGHEGHPEVRGPMGQVRMTLISENDSPPQLNRPVAVLTQPTLSKRDVAGPYVIGVQGNYGTEYWNGDIAEVILFARTLTDTEREAVWNYLANRYKLKLNAQPDDPLHLALASLCHVLMNTNEFLYID